MGARWWRFNAVGVLGFLVQLAVLAALTTFTPWPTELCVTIAVLLTVTHNFVWHTRYTWRHADGEPQRPARRARQWLAFNASNGLISLVCNVPLTTALAALGAPILAANIVAILIASLANFLVSDRVVFTR